MINKSTLLKIKKLAVKIDHDVAFDGKSKGNRHLFRVVQVAEFLARKTGADTDIVMAGALLHDTALPSGNDYEYSQNKRIVKNLLKSFYLTRDESNKVAECVASHEGTVRPKSLEAKIVHDADVLEKVGILGLIRHTWKMANRGKIDPLNVKDRDIVEIRKHILWRCKRLQTSLAKDMAKYLTVRVNGRKAKVITEVAACMAIQGIITEKIALAIRKHLNKKQNKKLREQLSLGYLRIFKNLDIDE